MSALEDYVRSQRKIKDRNDPMRDSVMSHPSVDPLAYSPEQDALEGSNPEDWVPSPKSVVALLAKGGAKLGGLGALGMLKRIPGGSLDIVRRNWGDEAADSVRKALRNTYNTKHEWGVGYHPETGARVWTSSKPDELTLSTDKLRRLSEPVQSPDEVFLMHTHPGGEVSPSKADLTNLVLPVGSREIITSPSRGSPLVMYSQRSSAPVGRDYERYVGSVINDAKNKDTLEYLISRGMFDPEYGDVSQLGEQLGSMSYLRNLAKGDKLDAWYNDLGKVNVSPGNTVNKADILEQYWKLLESRGYKRGGLVQYKECNCRK